MKTIFLIAAAVCLALGLALPSFGADPIKVGIVDTYTGPALTYSQDVLDGFKLAVEEVNGKGGVLGRKIEFVIRDHYCPVKIKSPAAPHSSRQTCVQVSG